MKKIVFTSLVIIGVLIFAQTSALACSCSLPTRKLSLKQQVKKSRKNFDAIFSGKVIEITKQPQNFYVSVRLLIENSWKGKLSKEITIVTGLGGGDCGYPFEVGESYLIYVSGSVESRFSTSICSRTTNLLNAAEDLKILGKGNVSVNIAAQN